MGSSPLTPRRIGILGVPVDCVTMHDALDFADELIGRAQPTAIMAVNPEKVMKARQDPWLRDQLRQAGLLLPDGIGVVWAARLLEGIALERVPGADFMVALCERAQTRGHRVFLYGASPAVNTAACAALHQMFPRLQIVGSRHGYVPQQEMAALVAEINHSGTDILFVALGSPRQEFWMSTYLPALGVKVCQGVGGTFDVLAGTVNRAPPSWRNRNLEWAYRLLREPRRLGRQAVLPKFAWRVLAERMTRDTARARGNT
jgi:N-acetylglucosaminyldiphosphoundecaprenol N-acetyl-beta-D-mannosaminyltransferase